MNQSKSIPSSTSGETDLWLERLGWIALCTLVGYTGYAYPGLPETIPVHLNARGEVDGFGQKWMFLLLPAIGVILFLGMSWITRFPHRFNYPVNITEDNASQQYANAARMIRVMKLSLAVLFLLLQWEISRRAHGTINPLGIGMLFIEIGIVLLPAVYFTVRSFQIK